METLLYFAIGLPLLVIVLVAIALSTGAKKYLEEMGLRFWHWLLRTNAPQASQAKENDSGQESNVQGDLSISVSDSPGTSAVGRDQHVGSVVHAGPGSTVIVGGSPGAGAATVPAAATQPPAAGITPQLPDPVADFTGRTSQADQLIARLRNRQGAAITAIGGQGGVGKTELAYYVAREVRELYPGGQVMVNLRGLDAEPLTPKQAMSNVILAVEPEQKLPDKPEQIAGIYRGLLAKRAVLVLADNAKDSEQVRTLVPKSPSALLVTSRQTVQLDGIKRVNLDELTRPDSKKLLRSILDNKPAEDSQLDSLAKLCGDLPLALRVAGNRLAASPALSVVEYLKQLEEKRAKLQFEGRDVMAVLAESVEALERDAPELAARWRSLTVFPAPFDRAAAEAVGEFEDGELDTLVGRSLVLYDAKDERFRLHDLMRDLARVGWGDDKAYNAAGRHAAYYLNVIGEAGSTYLRDAAGVLDGLRLFDRERAHIETGQAWGAEHSESDDRAATLAEEYPLIGIVGNILNLRLHSREQIRWLEASLRAARKLGNKDREGMALGSLGIRYAALGETRQAIESYEQHLAIARETGDRRGEGYALGNLGIAYRHLGETQRAIEYSEQQLAITRETGDRWGEGNALGSLGVAYAALGETRRAIESYEQVLVIARETGDRRGEGQTLSNLGSAYAALGEPRRAIESYEQRLAIARETGDRRGEGNALFNMGLALDNLGERAKAIEHARGSLAIFEQIEDPNAGKVRRQLEKWGEESEAGNHV